MFLDEHAMSLTRRTFGMAGWTEQLTEDGDMPRPDRFVEAD